MVISAILAPNASRCQVDASKTPRDQTKDSRSQLPVMLDTVSANAGRALSCPISR
jgi:hypothetical protein